MDKVKVCLTTQKYEDTTLSIESMTEDNGILTIILQKYYPGLKEGDIVSFIRCVVYEGETVPSLVKRYDTNILTVETFTIEISEDEIIKRTTITIEAPSDYRIAISNVTEENDYYRLDLSETHYLFAQDMLSLEENYDYSGLTFYYRDRNTGLTGETFSMEDVYFYDDDAIIGNIIEQRYCLFNIEQVNTYNECDTADTFYRLTPNFYYINDSLDRQSIYVKTLLTDEVNLYNAVYAPYNLFYYRDKEHNCHLWGDFDKYDEIGESIEDIDDVTVEYNSFRKKMVYSFADFVKSDSSLKIGFGFTQNVDYKHLYQEENLTNVFTKKVREAVIDDAPVIDMERVKFAPYYISGSTEVLASALTFNLHFRVREDLEESWRYTEADTPIWNTINNYSDITASNKEVGKSDMLYYLGFTDVDVQNQKAKISKSFLRLSFYNIPDPLTQRLLYYSTIFMDSGELFGKYVKAKEELRRQGEYSENIVLDSQNSPKNRLDCRFTVRDEFYTEKCSEGFNIYYFPSDVILSENSKKTIYMKVEFNHAGFGRTIPFMLCRNGQQNLSLDDYKQNLYIKLSLKYIEKDGEYKYVYLVDDDTDKTFDIDVENATITFNLFEPKLMK